MKKALVLTLALLFLSGAAWGRTDYFDAVTIAGAFTLSGTAATAFTGTTLAVDMSSTAVIDGATSVRNLSAGFNSLESPANRFGVNSTVYMQVATTATTGVTAITHTGTGPTVTWTASGGFDFVGAIALDAITAVGNLSVDGTTALVDGSTSVRNVSAGFTSLESPANRFGSDATVYTQIATTATTGVTAITNTGTGPTVGWTVPAWTFTNSTSNTTYTPSWVLGYDAGSALTFAVADTTGAVTITHAGNATRVTWTATNFDFVGAMAADAVTVSDVLTFSDAGTIDNTDADTLTLTETTVAIAGEASISGDLTLTGGEIKNTDNAGAVVAGTCTAAEYNVNGYHKTVLTLLGGTTFALEDKDDGGGIKIYDFPQGQVLILGTLVDATITLDTNVTAPYVMSVGTVVGVDSEATLTTTEANFVASTAVTNGAAQDFHGVSAATSVGLTGEPYNGTSTALPLFVNAAIAAGSITGGATLAATGGTVTVWWIYLGDI